MADNEFLLYMMDTGLTNVDNNKTRSLLYHIYEAYYSTIYK